MRRFVLLYHDCPPHYERPSHWDLMFEAAGVLRTWALERLPRDWLKAHARSAAFDANSPALAADNRVSGVRLADHRLDYLDIEGTLSGNRGAVIRVAEGTYRSDIETADRWRVELTGGELSGSLEVARENIDLEQWTLTWQSRLSEPATRRSRPK